VSVPADMLILRERRRRVAVPGSRTLYRVFARHDFSSEAIGAPIDHLRLQAALRCQASMPPRDRALAVALGADDVDAIEAAPQLAGAAYLASEMLPGDAASRAVTPALREYRLAAIRSAWLQSRGQEPDPELDAAGARLVGTLQSL